MRLRVDCERVKQSHSSTTTHSSKTKIYCDTRPLKTYLDLTRDFFEEECANLFIDLMEPVEKVIREAGLDKSLIDDIVLVGGSTRIPKIQELLADFFPGKELKRINPDEAVAIGAAIQAAVELKDIPEALAGFSLRDVTSLPLGIEMIGGDMNVILEVWYLINSFNAHPLLEKYDVPCDSEKPLPHNQTPFYPDGYIDKGL